MTNKSFDVEKNQIIKLVLSTILQNIFNLNTNKINKSIKQIALSIATLTHLNKKL